MFFKEWLPPSRYFLLQGYFCIGHCKVKRKQALTAGLTVPLWSKLLINKCPRLSQKNPTPTLSIPNCLFMSSQTNSCLLGRHRHMWSQELNQTKKNQNSSTLTLLNSLPSHLCPGKLPLGSCSQSSSPHLPRALRTGRCRWQTSKWAMGINTIWAGSAKLCRFWQLTGTSPVCPLSNTLFLAVYSRFWQTLTWSLIFHWGTVLMSVSCPH